MKTKVLLATLLLTLIAFNSYSQEKRTVGISGSIQGSQFGIMIPVWVGEKIVLAPMVGIKYSENVGSDIDLGISSRFYFKNEKLAPYAGIKLGTIINKPSSENEFGNEENVDLLFGLAFGAEYFITENLSFGIEAQGNFTKSDKHSHRYGNPDGLNFNTGTMISATIYF